MESYTVSFYSTYILLLTTATITFIEAIRTNIPAVQHIMNLETCISLIGGYFYSVFNEKLRRYQEHENMNIDWNEFTQLRYIDWAITTPFMLLVLSLVLSFNSKTKITFHWFALTILFNYMMLYIGYLGETDKLERMIADILGFLAFFGTFSIIFMQYVLPRFSRDNYILFGMYTLVWGMYGIAYNFSEINKNILMNYLDLISKCLIGIGLWIYYTKIIKFA
jgi:bacteriorhodopsin